MNHNNKPTLHLLGTFHTICNHDYDHCAFTGKVLRFAKMLQAQGYDVIEYSNGESISGAKEHVSILSKERVAEHTSKVSDFMLLANLQHPMRLEFEEKLIKEMSKRIKPRDIVCHPFGPTHASLLSVFPDAFHVETGIGYDNEPFGAFRIFESYAWMHYHQGMTKRRGLAYEWVVPNYYNKEDWEPNYEKGKYFLFLGRVIEGKGLYVVKEIAAKIKEPIRIYGMGDPTPFVGDNMVFYGPITGQKERSDLLRNAKAVIMPTQFTEPFGGVAVEAMMCGTPVISTNYGAFTETIEQGKTGFRCHTLGDFLTATLAIENLDRKYIADRARALYSTETVGKQYDLVFKQVSDLSFGGWYREISYTIEEPPLLWEQKWWGDCTDTKDEEEKQYVYAKHMGINVSENREYYVDCSEPISVLDVGGGPVSMLLKTKNLKKGTVLDPSTYPEWIMKRYEFNNIDYLQIAGENYCPENVLYDEVWIYNCLQHVQNAEQIIKNIKKITKKLRIFEWIERGACVGHPINLTKSDLENWIGQEGTVTYFQEPYVEGYAFSGVFDFN